MPLTHYSDFDLVDFEDPDFPFDDPDFFDEKDESASPNTYEDDFRLVFRHYVDRDLLEAFEYISYYFEGDQLGDFLRSQKRFNQTAHLGSLRRTIGVLPEYFEAATRSDI